MAGRGRRQPDRGSASTGQPAAAASVVHGLGIARAGTGDDHAARLIEDGRQRVDVGGTEHAGAGDRAVPRATIRPAGWQLVGHADQRIAEGEVEVDRAGPRAGGVSDGARHERPPAGRERDVRYARIGVAQRTAPPNRCVWSIVWGAATSRSSGGRSAVQTTSGTSAWCASTTAAWSSAAAVPLVHTTSAGRPVARPTPSAANEHDRSSWNTCSASSGRSASARASGVEREPGASMTWRTPARTASSASVAQNVAAALISPSCPVSCSAVKVDIWSDVVCPWCYIGKRRFEAALRRFPGAADVTVTFRAFQLDPSAPPGAATPVREVYERKFGPGQADQIIDRVTAMAADEGLTFHMDRAVRANTLLAHRLLWLAEQRGVQEAVKERLLRAYFGDGPQRRGPGHPGRPRGRVSASIGRRSSGSWRRTPARPRWPVT